MVHGYDMQLTSSRGRHGRIARPHNIVASSPAENSVLKVAREVSADAIEQPYDDHICKDEDVYDEDGEPELSIRLGKEESPTKKDQMIVSSLTIEMNKLCRNSYSCSSRPGLNTNSY